MDSDPLGDAAGAGGASAERGGWQGNGSGLGQAASTIRWVDGGGREVICTGKKLFYFNLKLDYLGELLMNVLGAPVVH